MYANKLKDFNGNIVVDDPEMYTTDYKSNGFGLVNTGYGTIIESLIEAANSGNYKFSKEFTGKIENLLNNEMGFGTSKRLQDKWCFL